jgi:predicted dehydrogenase
MFRIGVLGCGWIVRLSHIPAILETPEGVITAFYSRTRKSAEKTMKGYHRKIKRLLRKCKDEKVREYLNEGLNSKVYTTLDEFFNAVDGVDIATSPNTHMMFAKMAAERGKSIMLEKPAARTLFEIEEVYSEIEKVPVYVYSQRSYDECIDVGREIIKSGKLGKTKSFRGALGNAFLIYVHNKKQFWDPKISGGGALLDLGPHVYSVFRNWFGQEYKFESVREIGISTVKKTRRLFKQKDYKVEIDDKAIIEVKFNHPENGVITARFEAYWGNSDLYPKEAIRGNYFEVIGENGKMTIGDPNTYLIEYNDGSIEVIPFEGKFLSTGGANAFRYFIRNDQSRNPAWYAREMMIILEGGYISHHLEGRKLTEKDIQEYIGGFSFIKKCEERSLAIIQALFPIEK